MKRKGITIPFLEGKKIVLRPLSEDDINERYLSWVNNREITRYMETGIYPTTLKELQSFYKKIANSKSDIMFAILNKRNMLHIGNIKLGSINWVHRFADLGIMIGEKKFQGRGYGQEACRLVLEYAFKRLNLNKIILGVYGDHKLAITVYQKVGFRIEGRIKNLLYKDGEYCDKVIMGIAREEFLKRE